MASKMKILLNREGLLIGSRKLVISVGVDVRDGLEGAMVV